MLYKFLLKHSLVLFLTTVVFYSGCGSENIQEELKKSPMKTYPRAASYKLDSNLDSINDSLFVSFSVSTHTSENMPLILSVIEVFDKNKNLIKRSENSLTDTNQINNLIVDENFKHDTILVKCWGFYYDLVDDNSDGYPSKKLGAFSTPLREIRFPVEEK